MLSQWREIARDFSGRQARYGSLAFASIAIVLLYIATCVAAWVVTRREPRRAGTLPGATALLAIPGLTWVLAQSTRQEFLAVVLALAAGAATYAVTTRLGSAASLRPDTR